MPTLNRRDVVKGLGLATGAGLLPGFGLSAAHAAETVKLINVEHDSRPLDNAAYRAVYDAFVKKHPGIEIEFQVIPWEQARPKLLTQAQGNALPDMGRIAWVADLAAANAILPIEGKIDKALLDQVDPLLVLQAYGLGPDGARHLYALPWFVGTQSILVNKTLFDKAGLQLKDAWTTDEFTECCKALTIPGKQWGVALDGAGIGDPVQIFLSAIYSFGGQWVNGDPQSVEPEPIVFDSDATAAGIDWYSNLYLQGYAVPSAPSDTYKERDANFQSGKAAIAWQGPWSLLETRENFKQGGWEVASMPLPTGPAGAIPPSLGGGLAGLYRGAEKPGHEEAALLWVKFLSSDEGQRLYCETNGMIPASRTLQADPFWSQDPLYRGYIATMKGMKQMLPIWATGLEGLLDDVVPPLLQGVFLRQLQPADAAKEIQAQVIRGLKQNGVNVPNG